MCPIMVLAFGLFTLIGNFAILSEANVFLGHSQPQHATSMLSTQSEHALLAELEGTLGSGHRHATEKRLKRLEQMMSPIFGAMPKNENGNLEPASAGYILHRIFVQRHGWFIRALQPSDGAFAAWNTSIPTSILEERVPEQVTQLFESRLGQHGLGLKELAILAATLEHLVHKEALQRLSVSYKGADFSQEDTLSDVEAIQILERYMSIYILGDTLTTDLTEMTGRMVQRLYDSVNDVYHGWPETQQFLQEVYHSVAPKRDYLYHSDIEAVVDEIGERYGRFQDMECRRLKDLLVEVEDKGVGGAGRVRMADFYGKALHDGIKQFSESIDYLRQLGALDESDPSNLRVIIPNYISGPSNCLASSSFYSVCCLDECESILGQLEQRIASPQASSSEIVRLVLMIPSATVASNRTIAPWLRRRLDEIAEHHGGLIPLHGRLFAQWLHYAYPRECQFPHISGTINPQRPEDMLMVGNASHEELSVGADVMKQIIADAPSPRNSIAGAEADATEHSGMWSLHEELVVSHSAVQQPTRRQAGSIGMKEVALFGALLSFSIAVVRSLEPAWKGLPRAPSEKSSEKYFV